jgi:hypothetical protein
MALQLIAVRFSPSELLVRIILPLTIIAVPAALWPHRRHIGVWIMYVGLAANLAAILANGGLMPIRRETVEDAVGVERAAAYRTGEWIRGSKDVLVEHRRATALGDSVVVRLGGGGMVVSPGDIVILAGVLVLAAEACCASRAGAVRRKQDGSAPAQQEVGTSV